MQNDRNDLISRQAVSSWLKQYGQDVLHGKYEFSLMYIWKNLMDLPSAQPEKAQLSREGTTSDTISRQQAIEAVFKEGHGTIKERLERLPSVQPEPAIPLSWIEKHIEWLKSLDNEFANLAAAHISVMLKKWRSEQDETD